MFCHRLYALERRVLSALICMINWNVAEFFVWTHLDTGIKIEYRRKAGRQRDRLADKTEILTDTQTQKYTHTRGNSAFDGLA